MLSIIHDGKHMARHDYDLPPDYQKRIRELTMSDWYTAERSRRRASKQDTDTGEEAGILQKVVRSVKRRVEAAPETVSLSEYR